MIILIFFLKQAPRIIEVSQFNNTLEEHFINIMNELEE